jgi:LmbE family N-acetylglucosaminyl deacetylase
MAEQAGAAPAHRPRRLFHFLSHLAAEPAFVVDVTPVWEQKLRLVRCYASQITPHDAGDEGGHFLFGADILQRMETKARYFGEKISVGFGEPLVHLGPVPFGDPMLP